MGGPTATRNLVLFFEDNETIATLMATVLRDRLGLQVIWVETVADGLREFGRHQAEVCLVVADCRLPDGDGRVVGQQLRQREPELPVLLTSGRFGGDNYAPLVPGDLVQFLPKPYSPSELVAGVRLLLERSATARCGTVAGFV